MKQFVRQRPWQSGTAALVVILAIVAAWAFFGPGAMSKLKAQEVIGSVATARQQTMIWYGPVGFTRGHTIQGNYSNFGNAPVFIEWAISDAVTGFVHRSTFGKPMRIEP